MRHQAAHNLDRTGLWSSAPAWTVDTAWVEIDTQLLVWTAAGDLFALSTVGSVVARYFDGSIDLATLAEDLADAAAVPLEQARWHLAAIAVELQRWGAIEGVVIDDPVEPDAGAVEAAPAVVSEAFTRLDPVTGDEIRVTVEPGADGTTVTTEPLPDGLRRVTTEMSFTSGVGSSDPMAELVAEVLDGTRSVAELVPAESCLGSKLRNADDVALISIRCPDGAIRSVRCHDDDVAARLRTAAGDRLATGERGPVEAFVVTPLEGSGPVRVYDGLGRRRGRPRSVAETVTTIDEILGEVTTRHRTGIDAPLALAMYLAVRADRAVLLPAETLEDYRNRRDLRRAGWSTSAGVAMVHPDGRLARPSALDSDASVAEDPIGLMGPRPDASVMSIALGLALGGIGGPPAAVALERLVALSKRMASTAPPHGAPWDQVVSRLGRTGDG